MKLAHNTAWDSDLTQGKNALHMTEEDLRKIHRYRDVIKHVAGERDIDPAVIAAITSWKQIEVNDNPEKELREVTNKLAVCTEAIRSKFPTWTEEQRFKGGISAYNAEPRRVYSFDERDEYTTSKNFSNDVVDQAKWLKRNMDF